MKTSKFFDKVMWGHAQRGRPCSTSTPSWMRRTRAGRRLDTVTSVMRRAWRRWISVTALQYIKANKHNSWGKAITEKLTLIATTGGGSASNTIVPGDAIVQADNAAGM